MSNDYTPSTADVRHAATASYYGFEPEAFDRWLESVRTEARRLPVPSDGCVCGWHTQDAGGGYSETVPEYEPACPVHSEHVWDPRQGMWVSRDEERERIARNIEAVRDDVLSEWWRDGVDRAARIAREGEEVD